jgi:hypothetical protein
MHTSQRARQQQCVRIRQRASRCDSYTFFVLTHDASTWGQPTASIVRMATYPDMRVRATFSPASTRP